MIEQEFGSIMFYIFIINNMDKTRKEKVDLLHSWKYTLEEWNLYALWQFVDYSGTPIKKLIK